MKFLSDAAFGEIQAQLTWLRATVDKQNEQNLGLTQQIIELKRDGFARPTPAMAVQQQATVALDDRIMAAIRAITPEGTSVERELIQFANAALLADDEIEDIADAILAGSNIGDD